MKPLAVIFLALSYASIVAGQEPASTCKPPPPTSDWAVDDLRGPVKVIRTFETWFLTSDKTGITERQRRKFVSEVKFEADEPRGGSGAGVAGDSDTTVRYVCDDNGKVIEEIDTTRVHPEHFSPRRYDVYITTRATFTYDARGNKIEEKHFYPNGSLYATWVYNYDSNDRLIKETRIDKLGRLEEQKFYEYHPDGRPRMEIKFDNFCITQDGEFCKSVVSSGDGIFYYASKTAYRYDTQGNWVKQIESSMGGESKKTDWVLDKITEREISYYNKH